MDRLAYRPDEAATMIGVSKSTFYKLIRDGQIRTFKAANCTLVAPEELEQFIRVAKGGVDRAGQRFMESGSR